MTKAHKPGSQKPGSDKTKANGAKKPGSEAQSTKPKSQAEPSITLQSDTNKGKQSEKSRKQTTGGTAAQGARSTQPKEIKPTSPTQQQAESYNRETRRRMQHMGMGPYGETPADTVREKRQKRIDKRKQRQEEVKKTVVAKGPSTDVKLGRRNTYFLLVTIGIVVLIIIVALIIRFIGHSF
jgi:hypothetical protein